MAEWQERRQKPRGGTGCACVKLGLRRWDASALTMDLKGAGVRICLDRDAECAESAGHDLGVVAEEGVA